MIHRIGFDEAIELYESKDLNYLSKLATDIREAKNGKKVSKSNRGTISSIYHIISYIAD